MIAQTRCIGVAVFVLRQRPHGLEVLLLKRSGGGFEDEWCPVAGRIEPGESPAVCAVIGLYTAGPLQILLRLPGWASFETPAWYAPALVVGTTALMFTLILLTLADVGRRSRWSLRPAPADAP